MIKECLDSYVVKQMCKYIQRLFWNSISNLVLRFSLCLVYFFNMRCVHVTKFAFLLVLSRVAHCWEWIKQVLNILSVG